MATPTPPPPMYTDHPLALLETPKHKTGKTVNFTLDASHMCLSHNSLIRGFNSIYQQAPRVGGSDVRDFISYALAWHRLVEEHHRYEEEGFFLEIDKAVGHEGVMSHEVEQHATFHDGLASFKTYLTSLQTSPQPSRQLQEKDFHPTRLLEIMDSFSAAFHIHLSDEPGALGALSREANAPAIDLVAMADRMARRGFTFEFAVNCLPCLVLNMEAAEFEGGIWRGFPPVGGAPGRFVLLRVFPLWRRSVWRFASCGPDRARKRLAV